MKTLILALGNPVLSDDAVGWEIADRMAAILPEEEFHVLKESGATLDLVPQFQGYERLIVIDAVRIGEAPIGTVHRFALSDLASTVRYSSAHDVNFATAFAAASELGYHVPKDVRIYAVEVKELNRFAETCTPELKGKLGGIARRICDELCAAHSVDSC